MARLLECRLNGRDRHDAVADNVLLLDYLREKAGLTGTKTGCDGGECGACTVLIDDRPVLSCLTLAACVEGRRVDTVESLGHDGHLSAVQRGFHEKLGSQCGYCTPGFIMASAGLLRKNPQPERSGHHRSARQQYLPLHRLCEDHRGGAIRRRSAGARGGTVNIPVPARNIGTHVPLVDGPEKVSGRAKYTADIVAPGQLAGHIFRSPYSHAEIFVGRRLGGAQAARREGHRHRRRLRQDLRRAADRAQRASAGARPRALSRRAGGRRRGGRRRHRARGDPPHQA